MTDLCLKKPSDEILELPSLYQNFIHLSRYAKWRNDLQRRENWNETVTRYFDFFTEHLLENYKFDVSPYVDELKQNILNLNVMPSMRALMAAGVALKRDNVAGYNCAYVAVSDIKIFDEILYVLMCGTGVGFSVERQYIANLPCVSDELHLSNTIIMVEDSRIGWCVAFRQLISLLYSGQIAKWDVSGVRKKGESLKTFGGKASGPESLVELFQFTISKFKESIGRKLNSLEIHDIICKIATIVVVGGVRRSALISLSNLSDERMQKAKFGQWYLTDEHRALSNNSVAYTEKPNIGRFMNEWINLYESKSGERGIFNRKGVEKKIKSLNGRRELHDFGCNPCSEIILRSQQLCNLTEVVVRHDDTIETLKNKIKIATILGTIQSTLTNFRYLSKKWSFNCEEERLLGVSMTGIMDNSWMANKTKYVDEAGVEHELKDILTELREYAIEVNKEWANKLGINVSSAITTIKPSGSVSQLVDCASGIHARHNKYYIRTVRISKNDPIAQLMIDNKIPYESDLMNQSSYVFSFPVKCNDNCITRNDMTAIEQLEICKLYNDYWCDHKVSVTISVKEDEWLNVGAWVYDNFDDIAGISFLPYADHIYKQAPYTDCTEEEYLKALELMPKSINWMDIAKYENCDNTNINNELACTSNKCEL